MIVRGWSRFFAAAGIVAGVAFLGGCETEVVDFGDRTSGVPMGGGGRTIAAIGDEESCGDFSAATPSVATDSQGQPHVATSTREGNRIYLASKIGGGWQSMMLGRGAMDTPYHASRLIIPHIEIDAQNRAWVSAKFGTKEFGEMLGQGLWGLSSVDTAPTRLFFRFLGAKDTSKGNGNVALDPVEPDVGAVVSRDGVWVKVNTAGQITQRGNLFPGVSGEKLRFLISPRDGLPGVWHIAISGYPGGSGSGYPCTYQNSERHVAGSVPAVWASSRTYPEVGSDYWHPGIGIDRSNPLACYIAAYLHTGLAINIWDGQRMLFAVSGLPVVDAGASQVHRFPPQWAPANGGGAFVCWSRAGMIHIRHISITGEMGEDREICPGIEGTIMTDGSGRIHLAYVANSLLKYRLIQTQ